ncbi:MAG: DUF1858 domain-containing protein [Magnetococcales bacterium]|nr:DUF1858 domain-containing protein [Magnetococcales bacterium]
METIDLKKNMAQLLVEQPKLGDILSSHGIDCGSCIASQVDTLTDVVRMYKLDLNAILEKLQES